MGTLFFWVSKLVWLVLSPDSLLLILLIVAWVLAWRGSHRRAKQLLGIVVIVLIVIALLPVGEWVFSPLEKRFPTNPALPDRVDGIIVLGGTENAVRSALWNQVEMGDAAERDLALLMLARRYPDARLVFSGGSGSMADQGHKAVEVVKRLCEEQGVDLSRVVLEGRSRNTYENATYSKALVQPGPGETWILVTTAWHMPRSVGSFRKAGWPILPYPVDHWTDRGHLLRIDPGLADHLRDLTYGVKEWIGLVAYYVTGRTTALFPGPGR